MSEKMVRTQVYLPRDIYDKLQARAAKEALTLALQIRAALEDYLERVASEADDGILHADDPIFEMIGMYSSGASDGAANHDYYLYGAPRQAPDDAQAGPRALREKSAAPPPAKSKKPSAGKRAK